MQIVLLAAEGKNSNAIAEEFKVSQVTFGKGRRRFIGQGIEGLHDELRPGRHRSIAAEEIAELLKKTINTKPKDSTHWNCRDFAAEAGVWQSAVQRVWISFGLNPHRSRSFELFTAPFLVEKVRDIVGLYLDPPANALVLWVDEKSQYQALEGSQPALPMGLGYLEGNTHDYLRHGTTTLFAASDIARDKVIHQYKKRHRHQEFLQFLRRIDASGRRTCPPRLRSRP